MKHTALSRTAVLALCAALAACGDGPSQPPRPPAPTVASVSVTAPAPTMVVGATAQLTATPMTSTGTAVAGKTPQWQSSAEAVATVSAAGMVTAVGTGTARITATVDGKSGGVDLTVRAPVSRVEVTPSPADVAPGASRQLFATALSAANAPILDHAPATWSSADESIATVSGGVVTGVAGGTVEIRATIEGVQGTATVRVTVPVPSGLRFSAVSAGSLHACGLDTGGAAWCWGINQGKQLGAGSTETCTPNGSPIACSRYPIAVSGGLRFTSLHVGTEGGAAATCGITTAGRVACWGDGGYGKLGNGGTLSSASPVSPALPAGKTFTHVGVGARFACALASDGTAYCWGDNVVGTLGNGSPFADYVTTPVQVNTTERFTWLMAGSLTACGLTEDGRAFCWGQVGLTQQARSPVAVAPAHRFTRIGSGGGIGSDTHLCGLRADGQVICWGNNSAGQLGIPVENGNGFAAPVVAMGGLTFTAISVGSGYTCGIEPDGGVRCAGRNDNGELGIGTMGRTDVPTRVEGHTFRAVSTGWYSCGIRTDGIAYCWGRNDYGGLGTTEGTTCQSHPGVPTIACALRPVRIRGQD